MTTNQNKKRTTIQEVEAQMAAAFKAECGVDVEITLRPASKVTISGAAAAVDKVVAYVTSKCGWMFEERADDEECGSFAYLATP